MLDHAHFMDLEMCGSEDNPLFKGFGNIRHIRKAFLQD